LEDNRITRRARADVTDVHRQSPRMVRRQNLSPTSMRARHDDLFDPCRDAAASPIPPADPSSRHCGPFLLQQIRSYRQLAQDHDGPTASQIRTRVQRTAGSSRGTIPGVGAAVFIARSTTGCDDHVESGVRLPATRGDGSDSLTMYPHCLRRG
jgi:hypothetical protein